MKKLFFSFMVAGLVLPAVAQTKTLVNINDSGMAIQGYDPVAFFTDHKPVKGDPKFVSKRDGAIYFFASKEHKELFNADPMKYEPVYGGYCAYGVAHDRLVKVDVNAYQIVHGKLLMQYSTDIRDKFNKDPDGNLSKAEANWPGLVANKGK